MTHSVSMQNQNESTVVTKAEEWNALPSGVKSITVSGCDDYQNEVLDLSRFSALEALTIGDGCFNYVSKVSVVGLKKLKSVVIGAKSFQNESSDSELVVSECPELVSLSVGNESFKGFKEMKLSGVKALKTITIGDECLKDCDLVLKDLKSVESVQIGVNSFEKSRHTVVEGEVSALQSCLDCPKLMKMVLGSGTLRGVKSEHCDVVLKSCHSEMACAFCTGIYGIRSVKYTYCKSRHNLQG